VHESELKKFNQASEASGFLLKQQYLYFLGAEQVDAPKERNVKQYMVFSNEGY
jgi:hypothetical protein